MSNAVMATSLEKDDGPNPTTLLSEPETTLVVDEKPGTEVKTDHGPPPDGGLRAWLVVLGASICCFATFGYATSWGVFQTYYEVNLLSHKSPSDIAWIGSLQFSAIFIPGIIVGFVFDAGYFNSALAIATVLLCAATIITAECTEYYQFVLCQGILVGFSACFILNPVYAVMPQWFLKKRGLALGFTAVGTALGGTVIPIVVKNLLSSVGFKWTMRTLGLMLLFLLSISNLTMRRRIPPPGTPSHIFGTILKLDILSKNLPFTLYAFSTFVIYLGIYTELTYLDLSAILVGIDENFAFYLIAISNFASGFGRLGAGYLIDKFGAINVIIPASLVAALMTYVWPYVRGVAGFIILSIIYGASSSIFSSQLANPTMRFGPLPEVGRRLGYHATIMSFGILFGTPISGAINKDSHGFYDVGWWAGSITIFGTILMFVARCWKLGSIWGKF